MKKNLFLIFAFAMVSVFADIPQSITLESGNVRIRLDGKKRWNVNRIEWKNQLMGVDFSGAHYGVVYRPVTSKHPIGTGHDESGIGEKLISLKIYADHREVIPVEGKIIKGKHIRVERTSQIADLATKTSLIIENDIMRETAEISADKDIKLDHLYIFMHPWSTRFDKFHAIRANGDKIDVSFKSDNSFPNRKFVPSAAWYDTKTGFGAVTFIRNIEGKKSPMRYLWDRRIYRKDYLCDYYHSTFPAGKKVVYEAVTGFFRQQENDKWITDAELLLKKIQEESAPKHK